MQAINDRVIIRVGFMIESRGGIVLASETIDNGRIALNIGKVISCGQGVTLRTGEFIPVCVKEGDVIVWEQFGAIRFEVLGPDIVCVRSEDIGAVLKESEWKGRYLFEPEEVEAYKNKLEKDREEVRRVQIESQVEVDKKATYQCWKDECRQKTKDIERKLGDDICDACGNQMREKTFAPLGIVSGGTNGGHFRD